jgi:hypothetical protein
MHRDEGTDPGSGIHYLRLSVTSAPLSDGSPEPPRLTMECREKNGKHDLLWYLSFGGVPEQSFEPPFHATDTQLFPPPLPREKLTMDFEGYMKSKPFTRIWVEEPSGELRYCNSGMECPNMDSPLQFIAFLNALPGLHIQSATHDGSRPQEVLFATRPLLEAMKASPVCSL